MPFPGLLLAAALAAAPSPRSGVHVVESEVVRDVRVRLYGGVTAIVTFEATIAWRYGSARGRRTALFTQTYVRDGRAWRLAASHGSEVVRPTLENP